MRRRGVVARRIGPASAGLGSSACRPASSSAASRSRAARVAQMAFTATGYGTRSASRSRSSPTHVRNESSGGLSAARGELLRSIEHPLLSATRVFVSDPVRRHYGLSATAFVSKYGPSATLPISNTARHQHGSSAAGSANGAACRRQGAKEWFIDGRRSGESSSKTGTIGRATASRPGEVDLLIRNAWGAPIPVRRCLRRSEPE